MSVARLVKRAKKKAVKKAAKTSRAQARKNTAAAAADNNNSRRKIGQYQHKNQNAKRLNNPAAGIAEMGDDAQSPDTQYQFDPHLQPQLLWNNKRQRDQLNIPVRPLHIHERIDPQAIIRAVRRNGNGTALPFELPEENPPLERAVQFYQHRQNWSNRLIAGDSLLVINSLLEKESMAGKVQCVYMDPPYGIKYGGNFQPFVNKRDVKDKDDKDLTTEPEMIRAFRDTWELGIHSYLSYLRDRLALCRELLNDSGSCFVQISDENVHLVRCIMDEIFHPDNFVAIINFRRKVNVMNPKHLGVVNDYLLFYAKNKEQLKFRKIYEARPPVLGDTWSHVLLRNGTRRKLTAAEIMGESPLPEGARVFASYKLAPAGFNASATFDVSYKGKTYQPPLTGGRRSWKTHSEGMARLVKKDRVIPQGDTLRYVAFFDDFPYKEITHSWDQPFFSSDKVYVVQTGEGAVQRCLLMTTDPGDLVFDPTCGSGTTAHVAEQWGRRWITCDASRVALAIARQRLLTANFPHYKLRDERAGADGGFVCKTVPHITLKSIANDERPETETLNDHPEVERGKARVAGPFTVEALPSQVVASPDEISAETDAEADMAVASARESSRHGMWRDELSDNGARGKDGNVIRFSRVETCGVGRFLHLEIETEGANPERGFVSFGREHSPMSAAQVALALEEADKRSPRPRLLVFAEFAFDPQAARTLDEFNWRGGHIVRATMDPDLHVQDLKRHKRKEGDAAFWLMGRPDAELRRAGAGSEEWVAEVLGFDYYNPRKAAGARLEQGGKENIAMWMLDPDYDGRQLYPRQVFFPMGGKEGGWAHLARNLRRELDPDLMEKYRGTVSLPFKLGDFRRAAVKIVDDRGIESLRILEAPEE